MSKLSLLGSLIGFVVGIAGFLNKEYLISCFGILLFIFGVFTFFYIKKQKEYFKKECNKDILKLLKKPTKENKIKINQLKIIKELK